jgi:hypothetical protein
VTALVSDAEWRGILDGKMRLIRDSDCTECLRALEWLGDRLKIGWGADVIVWDEEYVGW